MTYHPNLKFSDCELAGAVADAALHDLRVNLFSFPGFPQIDISGNPDGSFTVALTWMKAPSVRFQLSEAKAMAAVQKFTSSTGHDPTILNKVQEALIDLEGKASRYRTK